MLTCNSCMNRCLQTLIGDYAAVLRVHRAPFSTNVRRENKRNDTPKGYHRPEAASRIDFEPKKAIESASHKRQRWLESRGVTPLHKKTQKVVDNTVMRTQLRHLKDPLKLAEHVRATLREDDFETAVAIVRAASKDTQCVVSWNHLIDWQLSKKKMNDAIKTYNEMKKRAQTPDNHTYTIIFRGCAEHPLPSQALSKVMTIYHSMLRDKSSIQPNSIHLNAVLKMCARANDMDAMLTIMSRLPEKGVGSPTKMTYTIILNAIRIHTLDSLRGELTELQRRKIRQKANIDARRLWEHIVKRWRAGDILIDEELICTMGRVLLLGNNKDIDDILSLIEQTMDIPRQTPRISSEPLQELDSRSQEAEEIPSKYKAMISRHETNPSWEELSVAAIDTSQTFALDMKSPGLFAKPGANTLSLLMQALLDLRMKEVATKYWNILTDDYGVEPDAANYHGYLRILRMARASTETVKLLLKMPQQDLATKTFRIAMSTCRRDKNNQHAFSNAGKTLDLMQTVFSAPDVQVLSDYLDAAFSVTAYSQSLSLNDEKSASKYAQGKQILRAIERLNPSYMNLRSLLAYGDPTKDAPTDQETRDLIDSVLNLTRKLVSAHDLLLNKQMVDRQKHSELITQRSKLAAYITRFKDHKTRIRHRSLPLAVQKDLTKNQDFQRRMDAAKVAGPRAVEALLEVVATGAMDSASRDEKDLNAQQDDEVRGKLTEGFAERERQAAALAWTSRPAGEVPHVSPSHV